MAMAINSTRQRELRRRQQQTPTQNTTQQFSCNVREEITLCVVQLVAMVRIVHKSFIVGGNCWKRSTSMLRRQQSLQIQISRGENCFVEVPTVTRTQFSPTEKQKIGCNFSIFCPRTTIVVELITRQRHNSSNIWSSSTAGVKPVFNSRFGSLTVVFTSVLHRIQTTDARDLFERD